MQSLYQFVTHRIYAFRIKMLDMEFMIYFGRFENKRSDKKIVILVKQARPYLHLPNLFSTLARGKSLQGMDVLEKPCK